MDSITHIILGAAIGEIMAGRKLGKKAMLIGAVAQSLPDVDFIASFWLDTSHAVLAHRALTHSFLFVLVMTPLLTWFAGRLWPHSGMTRRDWWFFFGLQLLVHILLDAFNAYGTGWFEPFDHYRVSFHTLFVVDPFYSVWLGIGFIALLLIRGHHPARRGWAWFGLIASTAYLGYCTFNKVRIDAHARAELQRQQLTFRRFISTPTPLNGLLWFVVAEDSGGFYTGYRSVFDHGPMHFRFQSRNAGLLEPWRKDEDLHCLVRFSQGFYTVEKWGDTLVFNDLRFGEMRGWEDPKARFVFHYFIQYPERNRLVVQRGRFEGWNGHTVRAMIRRIRGG